MKRSELKQLVREVIEEANIINSNNMSLEQLSKVNQIIIEIEWGAFKDSSDVDDDLYSAYKESCKYVKDLSENVLDENNSDSSYSISSVFNVIISDDNLKILNKKLEDITDEVFVDYPGPTLTYDIKSELFCYLAINSPNPLGFTYRNIKYLKEHEGYAETYNRAKFLQKKLGYKYVVGIKLIDGRTNLFKPIVFEESRSKCVKEN